MVRRRRKDRKRTAPDASAELSDQTEAPQGTNKPPSVPLPKEAIRRVNIGQSFAEYDSALEDQTTYVYTPALHAARDGSSGKVFFVGRRGTGKTAIRKYCGQNGSHSRIIVPEIFSPSSKLHDLDSFSNTKQKPFRSLVSAFRRALQIEILDLWAESHPRYHDLPNSVRDELENYSSLDFDTRCLGFISSIKRALADEDDERWLQENKAFKQTAEEMKALGSGGINTHTILIDSIDDYWEGNDEGLIYLTAFMHACLETSTQIPWARTILFLRENIFERVRSRDTESSRLETAIVGMEWNERQLLELVERRLNRSLTAKYPLNGSTLAAFFEDSTEAWNSVLRYCQRRPRDVLIYVGNAVEAAQMNAHSVVLNEDVELARRRFSDNRFKDLGDEYAENYPQIAVVLSRFYGLGRIFTLGGIESFIRKLLKDPEVILRCGDWIYENSSPETFIRLLYNIGFIGIRSDDRPPKFRAIGPQDTSPPPISATTDIIVHRCYWDALDLQDKLVRSLPEGKEFGRVGVLEELPGGLSSSEYYGSLDLAIHALQELPKGAKGATDFEEVVGDIIKLCFFRALENVEERSRSEDGRVIRDWIAANRARDGFWALIRDTFNASQVIWECKNYEDLSADDFHQLSYYMTDIAGRFIVLAFRGEMKNSYYGHIKRIATNNRGFVLPLNEKDLMIFLRQARNGKIKEDHIQDRYDAIVRKLS